MQVIGLLAGVTVGRQDQVSERLGGLLGFAGVDGRGRDRDIDKLALPADSDRDQPAAGAALDLGVGKFLLGRHQLALHRRGGLE